MSDGTVTASNNSTTVVATAVDTPLTISGATTTNVNDNATATPFGGVTFTDPDMGETYTLTVTPSTTANGTLSNLGGGTVNGGVYALANVSLTAAQTALQGLVFTPTLHQVQPGSTVTTTFALQMTDGNLTASNNATTVLATAASTPATIAGTTPTTNITDAQTATPFSGVTFTDPDLATTPYTHCRPQRRGQRGGCQTWAAEPSAAASTL